MNTRLRKRVYLSRFLRILLSHVLWVGALPNTRRREGITLLRHHIVYSITVLIRQVLLFRISEALSPVDISLTFVSVFPQRIEHLVVLYVSLR